MIDKPLVQIEYSDIDGLIQTQWPEGKTLEYKRDIYGSTDADKKELLKDVSSFANTQGGDIYIGIEENKGVPVGIPGIIVPNVDSEILRLEHIIRNGVEPRIDFSIHAVETPTSTKVLILRINQSVLAPHRVVFGGRFGEFWARSSAGKFSMDTDQLRSAFTLTDSVYEQIRSFRQNRVMQVLRNDTPVPLEEGGKLILHLIPVSAFRSQQRFDVSRMHNLRTSFPPIAASGWDGRLNLDGFVSYAGRDDGHGFRSYSQFFRNGIVEAVLRGVVSNDAGRGKLLLAAYYERALTERFQSMDKFTKGLLEFKIEPPIWCFLSFVGVKGAVIPWKDYFSGGRQDIDRDVLLLPETVIDDLSRSGVELLRPSFDLVWNASGYPRSLNYDADGNWVGQ